MAVDYWSGQGAASAAEHWTVLTPSPARRGVAWRPTIALGLAASAVLGLAIGRTPISERLPVAASLYAALGWPANLRGLDFRNVRSTLVADGSERVLTVEGDIVSLRAGKQAVPDLALALQDAGGAPLYTWTAAAPRAAIEPGEAVAFRARLASAPAGAHDVAVRFAGAGSRGDNGR